jgi:hypothetical protein
MSIQQGFRKADRKKAWLKIAITGPSGSGKTYSALQIAAGMGKKIAVIDTENGSASLYSDKIECGFDVLEIDAPYTIDKYTNAMAIALKEGYEVLIIDSISHAWAGEGGLIAQKDDIDSRGGKNDKNKFTNWGAITKQHEKFKSWLLKVDIHLIVTMRSKQDYVIGEGNKPIKVGMAPVQREGMEYEFTSVLDLAMNHSAAVSKDRTGLLDGTLFTPTIETGQHLLAWLNGGSGELVRRPSPAPADNRPDPLEPLRKRMFAVAHELGYDDAAHAALVRLNFPELKTRRDMSKLQIETTMMLMKAIPPRPPTPPAYDGNPVGSPDDIAHAASESEGYGTEEYKP